MAPFIWDKDAERDRVAALTPAQRSAEFEADHRRDPVLPNPNALAGKAASYVSDLYQGGASEGDPFAPGGQEIARANQPGFNPTTKPTTTLTDSISAIEPLQDEFTTPSKIGSPRDLAGVGQSGPASLSIGPSDYETDVPGFSAADSAAKKLGYRNQRHMDYYGRKGPEGLGQGTSLGDARKMARGAERIGSQNVSPLGKFRAPSFAGGFGGGRGKGKTYRERVAAQGGGKFGGGFGRRREPAPIGSQPQGVAANTTDPSRRDYMQDPNQGLPAWGQPAPEDRPAAGTVGGGFGTDPMAAPATLSSIINRGDRGRGRTSQERGQEEVAAFRPLPPSMFGPQNTSNDWEERYGSQAGEYQV